MKKIYRILQISLIFSALLITSCKKDSNNEQDIDITTSKGLFVLNEGNYMNSNGSLSYYDIEKDSVINNLFYRTNGSPIGDTPLSLATYDGKMFIVVNNSNYIYKVDAGTIVYEAQLRDFISPRYMYVASSQKAYVTDLMAKGVWVINPSTMEHIRFIETGKPTENIVVRGNKMYVNNWSNYYVSTVENNTVQVIDMTADTLLNEIVVGKEPNSMVLDKTGHLYVLCSGGYDGQNNAKITIINTNNDAVIAEMDFGAGYPDCYPSYITISNDSTEVYYINNDVFKIEIGSTTLPTEPLIKHSEGMLFYNIAIDPSNGDIYLTDAKNYQQNGCVYRYTAGGQYVTSFQTGIIPSYIMFKN